MSNVERFHIGNTKERPDKHSYYLQIALDIANMSIKKVIGLMNDEPMEIDIKSYEQGEYNGK